MCGICCIFGNEGHELCSKESHAGEISLLRNRGPDCSSEHVVSVSNTCSLRLSGHVLHLRGSSVTPQPAKHSNGDLLLWNGEIFGGLQVGPEENDTTVLLHQLVRRNDPEHILKIMSAIEGPWSFVYWQSETRHLWFGRDVFGRRSLLWHLPATQTDVFCLSSVQIKPLDFEEIPSVGLFCINFNSIETCQSENFHSVQYPIKLFPWRSGVWPGTLSPVVGNEDISHKLYSKPVSPNVTFSTETDYQPVSPMPALNKTVPPEDYSLPPVGDKTHIQYLQELLSSHESLSKLSQQLTDVLLKAVTTRVNNQPREWKGTEGQINSSSADCDELTNQMIDSTARVAILFSGGIDSTVIAALADKCVPKGEQIDLINVAFKMKPKQPPPASKKRNNRPMDVKETKTSDQWNVPDRLTGHVALSELNPDRDWNFIEVNVTAEELQEIREKHIRHLLYPLHTVLDDSIGCAVWFAARGHGILGNGERQGQPIRSQARVILCGMGADEQLMGYSRHRVQFKELGWAGLLKEVELEITRISARNMGRDDRIITDHGKEARFPFLDENVVKFLSSQQVQHKGDLTLPRGLGEKILLRLCATQLGLFQTSALPKRAIQFGSRIAKMENSKEKGSQSCARLVDNG